MAREDGNESTPDTTGSDASDATWDNATDFATADSTLAQGNDAFAGVGRGTDDDLDDSVTRGGGARSFMHTVNIGDPTDETFDDVPIDVRVAGGPDVGTATAGGNTGIRGDTDPDLAAVMDRNEADRLGDGGALPGDTADDPERAYGVRP